MVQSFHLENTAARLLYQSVDVISQSELLPALKESQKDRVPLKIKWGCDPSRPDLHLGHLVVLKKLKQFQDLGHTVQLVIGDFTAQIGDPTGVNVTRPQLSADEVKHNAKSYVKQVFKILNRKKTEVYWNSKWLGRLKPAQFIHLTSQHTLARMLEREDFQARYKRRQPIALHEFLYPLLQAYDSVVLKTDIEVGGSDQLFNLLLGRGLQKQNSLPGQMVITYPLLEGTDGVKKMSKSYDNTISFEESPSQMFGKIMSLTDPLMHTYYKLLVCTNKEEEQKLEQDLKTKHPLQAKQELGLTLVEQFYGKKQAAKACEEFDRVFSKKQLPSQIKEYTLPPKNNVWIAYLLCDVRLCVSTSEAKRLIKGGAIELDGKKIRDENKKLDLSEGATFLLKAGKRRFAKVRVKNRVLK